jgi:hypothetical protein
MASDEAAALAARPVQPAATPVRLPSLASFFLEISEPDELTEASNAVVDMVHAGNLDAAELLQRLEQAWLLQSFEFTPATGLSDASWDWILALRQLHNAASATPKCL